MRSTFSSSRHHPYQVSRPSTSTASSSSQNQPFGGFNRSRPSQKTAPVFSTSRPLPHNFAPTYDVDSFDAPEVFYDEVDEPDNIINEATEMVLIDKKRLLSIFRFCPHCGHLLNEQSKKELHTVGTAGVIYFNCSQCTSRHKTWSTQEKIPNTKIYRGNAILCSAASITPVSYSVSQ